MLINVPGVSIGELQVTLDISFLQSAFTAFAFAHFVCSPTYPPGLRRSNQ